MQNARYLKKTHKFGIELPKLVAHALELDRQNGNMLWADAIAKEMKDVQPAFRILDSNDPDPVGHQNIRCHMIFDVKMEDFRLASCHVTEAPATITYASVVARDTVRLPLLLAKLNDLDVKVGDVLNAYITESVTEKIWTVFGPEFGVDTGKRDGLKSASAASLDKNTQNFSAVRNLFTPIFEIKNSINYL